MKRHGYFSWDSFLKWIYDVNGESCFPALLTHRQGMVEKAWISVIPIAFCEISGKQENPAVLLKVKSQLYAEHQGLRGDTDLTAYLSFGAARLVLLIGLAAAEGGHRISNRALGVGEGRASTGL